MSKEGNNHWEDDDMTKEAVSRFESMLSSDQSAYFDAEEFECIIDYYMSHDELDKSREAVDIAIAQHPTENSLKIKNARQFLMECNPNMALELLNDAEATYDDPDYFLTLGSCYAALGKSQKAIETYNAALPYFEEEEKADLYNAIAFEYHTLFNFKDSLEYLKKALPYTDDIETQYIDIRHCYCSMGQMDEAIAFFQQCIDANPHNSAAWQALGDCYRKLDQLEKAIDIYEYVLAINPSNALANMYVANAYYDLERFHEAIDTLNEGINNHLETSLVHASLGDCYYRLECYEDAKAHYLKSLQMNEALPEAWSGLGFVYSDTDDSDKAIKCFNKALKVDPDNTDHLYALAAEYRKAEDYEKALICMSSIEILTPDDSDFYYFTADILSDMKRYDEAVNVLNLGKERNVADPSLTYILSYIYFLKGDRVAGLDTLEKALDADFEGYNDNFIELNPDMLNGDVEILEMIERHKNSQDQMNDVSNSNNP